MLGADYSPSIMVVQRMMDGAMPGCPKLYFAIVDVRDVADLHIRAMTHPAAKGERFIAAAGATLSMLEIAKVLNARMGDAAKRVPTARNPELARAPRRLARSGREIDPAGTGLNKNVSNEKAKRVLGWPPRSNEEAIVASAESLIRLGLLKVSVKKAA